MFALYELEPLKISAFSFKGLRYQEIGEFSALVSQRPPRLLYVRCAKMATPGRRVCGGGADVLPHKEKPETPNPFTIETR